MRRIIGHGQAVFHPSEESLNGPDEPLASGDSVQKIPAMLADGFNRREKLANAPKIKHRKSVEDLGCSAMFPGR
jgi:hypothetical protein